MTVTVIIGGTFDPVHLGHTRSALAILALFDRADLYLVPCRLPPHRTAPAASAGDRLNMLRLAVGSLDRVHVDDCELQRPGPSYTYDTLRAYRDRLGDLPLIFALGFDAWVTLPEWSRWRQLCDAAHLMVLHRPGEHGAEPAQLSGWAAGRRVPQPDALTASPAGGVCHVSLDRVDVSATEIRRLLMRGEPIGGLVHDGVNQYIRSHGLYLTAAVAAKGRDEQ